MIDKIVELPFIKSLGWSSLIAIIAGLIPLLGKMGIITSITSSKVERLLFSKEKRAYIGVINFVLTYLLVVFVTSSMTVMVSRVSFSMAGFNTIAIITLFSLILLLAIIYSPESIFIRFGKRALIFSLIIHMVHIFSLFIFTPILISASFNESNMTQLEIESMFNDPLKYKNTLLLLLLILSVANLLFLAISYFTTINFFKKFSTEKYYVVDASDSSHWFIYHPVDKEHILLGNDVSLDSATVFKIEERKKLLTEKINRLRLTNYSNESKTQEKVKKKNGYISPDPRRRVTRKSSFPEIGRFSRRRRLGKLRR
ncbi:hypothetical protein [Paenibacillus apii]|uniref:hypothetical protein n=1 Tax=Paenibacillus apii TaxID=1850370 RepID=UPI00143A7B98|nr:hypothetical protein [Paenibacillus apii]NJJ37798.1 hypothetical protein [Paenibacillus apii]